LQLAQRYFVPVVSPRSFLTDPSAKSDAVLHAGQIMNFADFFP